MYLIIGATGRTGAQTLADLQARGVQTRALVRDGSKLTVQPTEIVEGSVQDTETLAKAMSDVTGVYLSLGNFPGQEDTELGIVAAAKAAGVRKIVKLSGPSAGPDSPVAIARMHGRIEAEIADGGFEYVFLRPYAFFQNLTNQIGPLAHLRSLFGSTGNAALNMVDARDVGSVAARVLVSPDWVGQRLELTGDEALTYGQITERLSHLTGEPYRFLNRDAATYHAELLQQGLPDWTAEHVIEIQAMTVARPEVPNNNVRNILGRPARTIDSYLPELVVQIDAAKPRVVSALENAS